MTTAQAIQEMMDAWNTIMAKARTEFPLANEEELFSIVSDAMNKALSK